VSKVRIAVAGAGLIGQRHLEEIDASSAAEIAGIVDPFPAAKEVAAEFSVALYASLAELFGKDTPDGTGVSLSVPTMRLKVYEGPRSWWEPFISTTAELERTDPLANQIEHSRPSFVVRRSRSAVAGTGSRRCWWSTRCGSRPAPGIRLTSRPESARICECWCVGLGRGCCQDRWWCLGMTLRGSGRFGVP